MPEILRPSATSPSQISLARKARPLLSDEIRARALCSVDKWVETAKSIFGSYAYAPAVHFDLKGRVAGRAYGVRRQIGLNAVLLSENPEEFEQNIIPHELAHLIVREMHGKRVPHHGVEWQNAMERLGVPAKRCHSMDVSRASKVTHVSGYRCGCENIQSLSALKHKRSFSGAATYTCRTCREVMRYCG